MKKVRKLLTFALSVIFLFTVGASVLTACDEPEEEVPSTCKLTIAQYDTTKGTVSLSPAKEEYALGEKVTISIQAKTDYEIQSVYIGNRNFTSRLRGDKTDFATTSYDWLADRDTVVTVEFQQEGVWKSEDYKYALDKGTYNTSKGSLVVSPDRSMYAQDEEVSITITTTNGSKLKTFKINEVDKKADVVFDGNYTYTYTLVMTEDTVLNIVLDDDLTQIYNANIDNFDTLIQREGKVVLDFYGTQCPPCQVLATLFEQYIADLKANNAAAIAADVKIVKVNVGPISSVDPNSPNYPIYQRYGNLNKSGGIPFMVMLDNGNVVGYFSGMYNDYSWLLGWLTNPTKG